MLKFIVRPKTPGMTSKKKKSSAFPEGISSFAGDFVLIWMKQRLIWFNLQRDETRNGLPNIKETFVENLLLKMSIICKFKFGLKDPIKIPILSALEKICHIPHVIFQTTSQLKVMLDKSVNNVLGEGM